MKTRERYENSWTLWKLLNIIKTLEHYEYMWILWITAPIQCCSQYPSGYNDCHHGKSFYFNLHTKTTCQQRPVWCFHLCGLVSNRFDWKFIWCNNIINICYHLQKLAIIYVEYKQQLLVNSKISETIKSERSQRQWTNWI